MGSRNSRRLAADNGQSERSELSPLREHFTAVGMGYRPVGWADAHGNRIRFEGWMQARTAGPLQGHAIDAEDERRRRRRYFEVAPQTGATTVSR